MVIELFAGSERLTAHLKQLGIKHAFGVDHKSSSEIAPIKIVDLTAEEGQWCESPLLAGVFAAPPCGTCSLARNIPLYDEYRSPIPGPTPLRSETMPNGLPFLKAVGRPRIFSANRLYEFLSKIENSLFVGPKRNSSGN